MNVKKIREMIHAKYREHLNGGPQDEGFFSEYLNRLDCTVIDEDDVRQDFEDIVNYSVQGKVCITCEDPNARVYILMPKELAQKALVFGCLPDSWSPETAAS
jgi:hypothetical protein